MEGSVSQTEPPPSQGASITFPRNGETFNTTPITVTGICPTGLLVKLYKNGVFTGAVMCTNGSFSLQIDLFSGTNELVARVFDALDREGPVSNTVTVNFPLAQFGAVSRPTLTSAYAKRGANPNEELVWPIALSGGVGPYAVSVDWGDGSTPDIISVALPGTFDIKHIYKTPGVYNVVIRATDARGETAFLQLVGVANGEAGQGNQTDKEPEPVQKIEAKLGWRYVWLPLLLTIPFLITSFWLGKRHERHALKHRIERERNKTL